MGPIVRLAMVMVVMVSMVGIVVIMIVVIVIMTMRRPMRVVMAMVVMMVTAAEQEDAGHVDAEPDRRDRDRFVVLDRDRRDETHDRLVADQHGDHRQHHGAGESREIAELAGAEAEALVVGMPARIAVGE